MYEVGKTCPHCHHLTAKRREAELHSKNLKLRELTDPLPGSQPYDNYRPVNVPLKCDGQPMAEFCNEIDEDLNCEETTGYSAGETIIMKTNTLTRAKNGRIQLHQTKAITDLEGNILMQYTQEGTTTNQEQVTEDQYYRIPIITKIKTNNETPEGVYFVHQIIWSTDWDESYETKEPIVIIK